MVSTYTNLAILEVTFGGNFWKRFLDAMYGVILEAIFGGDFGGDDSLTYMHFDSLLVSKVPKSYSEK